MLFRAVGGKGVIDDDEVREIRRMTLKSPKGNDDERRDNILMKR